MKRRRRTPQQREAIFRDRGGKCCWCGGAIVPGEAWDLDHGGKLGSDLWHTGDDSDDNLHPIHRVRLDGKRCHVEKTAQDAAFRAKTKRMARMTPAKSKEGPGHRAATKGPPPGRRWAKRKIRSRGFQPLARNGERWTGFRWRKE